MAADGSGPVPLSNQPFSSRPVWSPDGTRIAYDADGDSDGWQEVWLMNANGSGQQQLLSPSPGNQYEYLVSNWSADGDHIGFTGVRYVLHDGAWYWTSAYMYAKPLGWGMSSLLSIDPTNWYPSWGTLDVLAPTSTLAPLPAESPDHTSLSWTAADLGPAGLRGVQLEIKDGAAGKWYDVGAAPDDRQYIFYGVAAHTYYFRLRAFDNHYNYQPWPDSYDAVTTVEALPPIVYFLPGTGYMRANSDIHWDGWDPGGSGISYYDVQYRTQPAGAWQNLTSGDPGNSATFNGTPGNTYGFRIRAVDLAFNRTVFPVEPSAVFTIYQHAITGAVYDLRHIGLPGAVVDVQPAAITTVSTGASGGYTAYLASKSVYSLTLSKVGYGAAPAVVRQVTGADAQFTASLPLLTDLAHNGNFEAEAGPLTGWSATGVVTPSTSAGVALTGKGSVLLQSSTALELSASEVISGGAESQPALAVASRISQIITLTAGLHQPTLSLWYQLERTGPQTEPGLRVTISGASGTTEIISATTATTGWTQAWADLSPWSGQTVTLTIEARTPAAHGATKLRLDDVAIGEWLTPVAQSIAPLNVPVAMAASLTLHGQNFIKDGTAVPQVYFNGTPAASVAWLNANTLTVQAPPLPRGGYDITVVNPGGQDSSLPFALFSGYRLLLPLVGK